MSIEDIIEQSVFRAVSPLAKQIEEMRHEIQVLMRPRDETPLKDEDAARRIGVGVATLRRMKTDGRMDTVKTRTDKKVVRVCDIEEYEKRQGLMP